jgi:hypothetical protein
MTRAKTRAHTGAGWLMLSLFALPCALSYRASLAAADDVPSFQNPYARAKPAAALVHGSVTSAVSAKVAECFRAEQQKPLDADQHALLAEYGVDVARELAPAITPLGCALDAPISAACKSALSALSCDTLAEPIVAAGWDRNLSPEAKAKVVNYAAALAARDGACEGRAAEEAAIVQGVVADRLAALLESEIVMGKCELIAAEASACNAELAAASCQDLRQLKEQGQLTHLCRSLLHCTDVAAPP